MKSSDEGNLRNQYASRNSFWFFLTTLYIVLDYSRIYLIFHLQSFRLLMLVTLALTYFIFSSNEYKNAKSKQLTYIWLFIILMGCYIPFARNNHYAYLVTRDMLLYMPFIISVVISVNSIHRLKNFFLVLICIEIYIASYAFTHAGYGPGNYFDDENDLALYINIWLPFCFFLFFAYKQRIKKIICLIGLIMGLSSIVVSFSRGGFLGLIATGISIWLFSTKKIISMIIVIIIIALLFQFAGENYWKEMSTVTNAEEGTGRARIESWKSGWRMFLDNPLGVGGLNFMVRFPEYQTEYFKRGMWGRVAHSLWFTLIPELGVFGIFIYFRLLIYNIKDIIRLKNIQFDDADEDKKFLSYTGRAFIPALVGYFAAGSFLSVLYYAHYWYLIGIIVCAIQIARKRKWLNNESI